MMSTHHADDKVWLRYCHGLNDLQLSNGCCQGPTTALGDCFVRQRGKTIARIASPQDQRALPFTFQDLRNEKPNLLCSTSAFVDMQKYEWWWLNPAESRFVVEANVRGPVGSNCFLAASFV